MYRHPFSYIYPRQRRMLWLHNDIEQRKLLQSAIYFGKWGCFGIGLEIEKYTDKYYICTYVSRTNNFVLKHCVMLDDFLWFVFIFRLCMTLFCV